MNEPKKRGRPKGSGKTATIGDNSGLMSGDARTQLKALTERLMNLFGERDDVNADIKEVFKEAADSGFDTKILRKAITRLRADQVQRAAEEEMIALYMDAISGKLLELFDESEPSQDPGAPTTAETDFAPVE